MTPATPDLMPQLPEPMGLFCGTRNDPPKDREFWGIVTGDTPHHKCDVYTLDHLTAYAKDYAQQHSAALLKEVEGLRARNMALREALQQLSDTEQFDDDHPQLEAARKKAYDALAKGQQTEGVQK